MGFECRGETVVGAASLDDLKLVYRVLHNSLKRNPELMDGDFLADLQEFLHRQAQAEGVDGADHGAWEAWLGAPQPFRRQTKAFS